MLTTLIVIVLIICLFLLIRGLCFRPKGRRNIAPEMIHVDVETATDHLQQLIRCRTVSAEALRDEGEFEKLRSLLPEFYPALFAASQVERVDRTGVLIHWKGENQDAPAVLLGHYDVVPADEKGWSVPPFAAVIKDGCLWGRGALDMKNQLSAMLEAAEMLAGSGFTPAHDIYFALSGEEEVMGKSAESMRDLLRDRGVAPAFVLDEGGDIIDGFFPGTSVPCAMVGIGEKGLMNLTFSVKGSGGHAATPKKNDPLPRLCRAMARMERHPFPLHPGPSLDCLVDTMGRYCALPQRVLLANRRILKPIYYRWLRKKDGMIAASARTTLALTQAKGSQAPNVIPTEASMTANVRLLWGDTPESVVERLNAAISDPAVEITAQVSSLPRPDSTMTYGYREIKHAIEATWPEAVVSPYLMVACTDSRYWRDICDNVYRFSAKAVSGAEKATVHGNDERLPLPNIENAIAFYYRLMKGL